MSLRWGSLLFRFVLRACEAVAKQVPSAKADSFYFHFGVPSTSVLGFTIPPLRG